MGEEVTQPEVMPKSSSAGSDGTDETDKATPARNDECDARSLIEKCDGSATKCDGSVCQPQAQAEKENSPKKPSVSVSSTKPQDNSFEKSKKWYNISFMHRAGSSSNSRSANTTDKTNSIKMDSRHSWHLNDSVEM